MLKKDIILWQRSWRRMAFEIIFPMLIFVVISIIRIKIPIKTSQNPTNLARYAVPLSAFPSPDLVGIPWWKEDAEDLKGLAGS